MEDARAGSEDAGRVAGGPPPADMTIPAGEMRVVAHHPGGRQQQQPPVVLRHRQAARLEVALAIDRVAAASALVEAGSGRAGTIMTWP